MNKCQLKAGLWILIALVQFQVLAQDVRPIETFETCWKLFDESYASFEEKNIDWQAAYDTYRPQVSANTSHEDLFVILTKMLKPLGDAHVNLIARNIDTAFSADRPSRMLDQIRHLPGRKKPYIEAMTNQTLYENGFEEVKKIGPVFRDDTLFSFTRSSKIGYLRFFRSFSSPAKMVGGGLDEQLNHIFKSFEGVDAIILDARFNMGGDDAFSQKLVGRFVEEKVVGFRKQTRKKKVFGEIKDKYIKPEGETPFLKPVILLTNDQTFSAADVLALMMESLPNATLIGEPSNGSYSDLYGRRLPNGWRVTLSNQRYYSVDLKNYEGLGTPVDIEALNTKEDFEKKDDSVLEAALEFLKNG